jgi:hypothetical protein
MRDFLNSLTFVVAVWAFLMGGITFSSIVKGNYEKEIHKLQKEAIEKGYGEFKIEDRKITFNWK